MRATVAKTPTGKTVCLVRCPACGWAVAVDPRDFFDALKHDCRQTRLQEAVT